MFACRWQTLSTWMLTDGVVFFSIRIATFCFCDSWSSSIDDYQISNRVDFLINSVVRVPRDGSVFWFSVWSLIRQEETNIEPKFIEEMIELRCIEIEAVFSSFSQYSLAKRGEYSLARRVSFTADAIEIICNWIGVSFTSFQSVCHYFGLQSQRLVRDFLEFDWDFGWRPPLTLDCYIVKLGGVSMNSIHDLVVEGLCVLFCIHEDYLGLLLSWWTEVWNCASHCDGRWEMVQRFLPFRSLWTTV